MKTELEKVTPTNSRTAVERGIREDDCGCVRCLVCGNWHPSHGRCPPLGVICCHELPPLTAAQEQPRPGEQPRSAVAPAPGEWSKDQAQSFLARMDRDAPVMTIGSVEDLARDMLRQGHEAGVMEAADFVESHASKLTSEASGLTRDVLFAIAAQLRASVGAKGVVRS